MERPNLNRFAIVLAVLLATLPVAARADMPIFLVFASVRVMFWWTVILAILIEAVALWLLFALSPGRALLAAFLVNLGTALLGFVLYPLVGMLSYPTLAPLVSALFGTGEEVEIAVHCVAAAVIDTPVELLLLVFLSKVAGYGVRLSWPTGLWFFVANLLSAAVLFAALHLEVRKAEIDPATLAALETRFNDEIAMVHEMFEDLPAHVVQEDGGAAIDPAWRQEMKARAEALDFLELNVLEGNGLYSIVPMSFDHGGGYSYSYDSENFDGRTRIMLGRIEKWRPGETAGSEIMDVVHYHLIHEAEGDSYAVRAILLASPED